MTDTTNNKGKTTPDLQEDELSILAGARASFCSFLNIHFMNLPDKSFVDRVREQSFGQVLEDLTEDENVNPEIAQGASLMQSYLAETEDLDSGELTEKLGVDRTRLYRGISPNYGPPPPYEGLWDDTTPAGTELLQKIASAYGEGGLAPSDDARERLDYIGLELDYLGQMARKEFSAREAGRTDEAIIALKIQEAFVREHLGKWVSKFVQKALEHAETDFYKGHLHMLKGFIEEAVKGLEQLVENK